MRGGERGLTIHLSWFYRHPAIKPRHFHLSSPSDITSFHSSFQLAALKYNATAFYEHRPLNSANAQALNKNSPFLPVPSLFHSN